MTNQKPQQIVVVGPHPESKYLDHPGGQVTATRGLLEYFKITNTPCHVIDTCQSSFPAPSVIVRLWRGLERTILLLRVLVNERPGGVIIFTGERFSMVERGLQALLCKLLRVPAVMFLRSGYIISDAEDSMFFRKLYRTVLRIPDQVAVQGSQWIDKLSKLGLNVSHYKVVPNWLPRDYRILAKPRKIDNHRPIRFLYVGWLTERKGVKELMAAFDAVAPIGEAQLTIVGGGDLIEDVQQWGNLYPDKVHITGWLDSEKLPEIYAENDVLLLPSYAEGFPNVLIEAMAHGLPVIATPVGGIADSLSDGFNGLLVAVKDSKSLAYAIKKYIDNRSLVMAHSANAIDTIKRKHDADINCEQLMQLFLSKHS